MLFVIRRLQHATPGIFVSNIIVKENCGDSDAALDLEGKIHWESMVRNITSQSSLRRSHEQTADAVVLAICSAGKVLLNSAAAPIFASIITHK